MKAQLLDIVIVAVMTGLLLWLRQAFLSLGRKGKENATQSNLLSVPPDNEKSGDDLKQTKSDRSLVQVEEFLAELRAKARGQAVASLGRNGPMGRP